MSEVTAMERPPEPNWLAMTAEELVAYRDAEIRFRASSAARAITGDPDPGAAIQWQKAALPGRELPVRVYRPAPGRDGEGASRTHLPLVLHVHGGGFVGTAVQSDWVNSHLAARLPAIVVSVEHRLLAPETPLSAAADDGWGALQHVVRHAARWGIDPARTAVFGESCGALISALAAIRAAETGPHLQAQVLVNPAVDVTDTMLDHTSVTQHTHTPTLTVPQLRLFQRRRSVAHLSSEPITRGMSSAAVVTRRNPKARRSGSAWRWPSASHRHQAMTASWLRSMPANAETSAGPAGPP